MKHWVTIVAIILFSGVLIEAQRARRGPKKICKAEATQQCPEGSRYISWVIPVNEPCPTGNQLGDFYKTKRGKGKGRKKNGREDFEEDFDFVEEEDRKRFQKMKGFRGHKRYCKGNSPLAPSVLKVCSYCKNRKTKEATALNTCDISCSPDRKLLCACQ